MKITKSDFKVFKKEFKRLVKIFGLTDWTVYFKHDTFNKNIAEILADAQSRVVTIRLNTNVGKEWKGPKETAMHEVGHLLTTDLSNMASNGEAQWLVYKCNEKFAARFANALLGKI